MLPGRANALARRGSGVVFDHLATGASVEERHRGSLQQPSRELHARLADEALHRALAGFRPLDHRNRALVHPFMQVSLGFNLGHLRDPLAHNLRVDHGGVAREAHGDRGRGELRADGLDLHVVDLSGGGVAHVEAARDGHERREQRVGDVDGSVPDRRGRGVVHPRMILRGDVGRG